MKRYSKALQYYVPEDQKQELIALKDSLGFWKKGFLLIFLMPTLIWLFLLVTVVQIVVFLFRARLDRYVVRFVVGIKKQIKGRFTNEKP